MTTGSNYSKIHIFSFDYFKIDHKVHSRTRFAQKQFQEHTLVLVEILKVNKRIIASKLSALRYHGHILK